MSIFKKLIQILTLKCEGATFLASRSLDETLDAAERSALDVHCLCCASCRRARSQFALIEKVLNSPIAEDSDIEGESLPLEAKERLVQTLIRNS